VLCSARSRRREPTQRGQNSNETEAPPHHWVLWKFPSQLVVTHTHGLRRRLYSPLLYTLDAVLYASL